MPSCSVHAAARLQILPNGHDMLRIRVLGSAPGEFFHEFQDNQTPDDNFCTRGGGNFRCHLLLHLPFKSLREVSQECFRWAGIPTEPSQNRNYFEHELQRGSLRQNVRRLDRQEWRNRRIEAASRCLGAPAVSSRSRSEQSRSVLEELLRPASGHQKVNLNSKKENLF